MNNACFRGLNSKCIRLFAMVSKMWLFDNCEFSLDVDVRASKEVADSGEFFGHSFFDIVDVGGMGKVVIEIIPEVFILVGIRNENVINMKFFLFAVETVADVHDSTFGNVDILKFPRIGSSVDVTQIWVFGGCQKCYGGGGK